MRRRPGGEGLSPLCRSGNGTKPVTYHFVFHELMHLLKAMKTDSETRVQTLEQRNADLEARVLELEASHAAARTEQHVD